MTRPHTDVDARHLARTPAECVPDESLCSLAFAKRRACRAVRRAFSDPPVGRPEHHVHAAASMSAQVVATSPNDPGFPGLYKYTLTVTWDVGVHYPSHVDILIGLTDCACVCDPRLFKFGSPAGTSTGVNGTGSCTVPYSGLYACKGDPSIDAMTGPAIKFSPDETLCSTDETGTGTYVFYSPLPPSPVQVQPNAIAIKHGNSTCYGPLIGALPVCQCSVPASPTTW